MKWPNPRGHEILGSEGLLLLKRSWPASPPWRRLRICSSVAKRLLSGLSLTYLKERGNLNHRYFYLLAKTSCHMADKVFML
jgi:hypothetical protein